MAKSNMFEETADKREKEQAEVAAVVTGKIPEKKRTHNEDDFLNFSY